MRAFYVIIEEEKNFDSKSCVTLIKCRCIMCRHKSHRMIHEEDACIIEVYNEFLKKKENICFAKYS